MRIIAIPVKSLSRTKTRLSRVLSPLERAALTLAMLEDVLDATLAVPGWESWVISPDEAVLEIAARRRARPVAEARAPLSAAIRQVERDALERGAEAMAVLLGDVALVTKEALSGAFHTLGPVVVSPSERDGGTNMLLRRPPRSIPSLFGKGSFAKHAGAAAERDVPLCVARVPELAFDLDVPEDIATLVGAGRDGRATRACLDMDLPSRIAVGA